ncbi:MAG: hypothetical protein ABIO21_10580 [Pseudomonas sp.]
MIMQEKTLSYLESHIPEMAASAVTQAYWQALASGNTVLESLDGALYEISPDGTRKKLKNIAAPTTVVLGEKRRLR